MSFLRKAIKQFKADFEEESSTHRAYKQFKADLEQDIVLRQSARRSDTIRTTSDDLSRYRTSSTRSQNGDDLPTILTELADDSSDNEAVSPLPKRSLFQSLQHNPSVVPPNEFPLSVDSGQSSRAQSEPSKFIPFLERPISIDPMNKEVSRISSLFNASKRKTQNSTSSITSSVPSMEIVPPITQAKQVESAQQNLFMDVTLPLDPSSEGFPSALLSSRPGESNKPNGADNDTVNDFGQPELVEEPKSPNELPKPSNASSSKTTNSNTGPSTPLVKDMPNSLSNSTRDVPVESMQPSIIQTSQQSHESPPYYDSVVQTTLPTVINNVGPTPTAQNLPLTPNKSLERAFPPNPFETSVPGDFPLVESSTSSSVQSPPVTKARRKPSSVNPFLLALAATPQIVPAEAPEKVEQTKTSRPLQSFQSVDELSDSLTLNGHSGISPDDVLARKMEELGRLRRLESRNQLAQSKARPEVMSQQPPQPNRPTATPKLEPRFQLPTLQEDSSDVATLLREAYLERQKTLQMELDQALAELRDVRAENKRLTNVNQTQQRSISQLKNTLAEVGQLHDNSSNELKNQLRDANASLTVLNKEKKGWKNKLDSMQHRLSAAERQIRCLDYLTRHKLESRQEAAYGRPKRRGLLTSTPASTDVIRAMSALNEEIYQTCVLLVDGLERASTHSDKHRLQTKLLGEHLTAMMEDQAKPKSVYNMLLMQTVLEVFMVHWCSSIIEAFYPKQESFADLLVQLSAQNTRASGSTAICGKQIQIVQSSTTFTDHVKFTEWVQDIIQELGLLLMIGGMRVKTQRAQDFSTKILALIKVAYDLRTAMAEKDICGGLEVVIVLPGTPFQEEWMTDANRKGDRDHLDVDLVAGTSGIGLQRKVLMEGHLQSRMEFELKPKVVLARALNVNVKNYPFTASSQIL